MSIIAQEASLFAQVASKLNTADSIFNEALQIVASQDGQLKEIQQALDAAGVSSWCGDHMLTIPERVSLALGKVGE